MTYTNTHNGLLRKRRGFTLVEVLVYIAILVILSSVSVMSLLSLNTSLLRNETERVLTNSATVSLERIGHDVRAATVADTTTPGQLTLTAGPTTTVFAVSGGQVVVAVNGEQLGPLTSESVTVEGLTFTHYVGVGAELETELVRTALTLSVSTKAASTTKTYYTSSVLRGSYE